MKKKYTPTIKDKKDWVDFTKNLKNIYDKDLNKIQGNIIKKKIKKLDLNGLTLVQANRAVKKFIIQCFEEGYKNLLIITGKGIRSKVQNNPYLSEKMSVLKYSVPEFLKSDKELLNKSLEYNNVFRVTHSGRFKVISSLVANSLCSFFWY